MDYLDAKQEALVSALFGRGFAHYSSQEGLPSSLSARAALEMEGMGIPKGAAAPLATHAFYWKLPQDGYAALHESISRGEQSFSGQAAAQSQSAVNDALDLAYAEAGAYTKDSGRPCLIIPADFGNHRDYGPVLRVFVVELEPAVGAK